MRLNRILRGTANYFATPFSHNRRLFKEFDKWIRVRLRSMNQTQISIDNLFWISWALGKSFRVVFDFHGQDVIELPIMNTPTKMILSSRFGPVLTFLMVIWAVELINLFTGHQLSQFGIYPREVHGLIGVLFAPFLHANPIHAALNTAPFLILGGFVSLHGARTYLMVSGLVILLAGSAVWLLGRPAYHVGASALVFGYFGFLVARGWYDRGFLSLIIAIVTVILYGGIIWGVLPVKSYISWEGHLFGLIAGVVTARLFAGKRSPGFRK
uniref:Rhomboid family protein n=1 Tax=Candidatus Kentrum sp. MB TaxID=2138164 RepID=A0A450XT39_9GAMM|nr:MAG: Rhomboid family protein [Candidatus Kentron sp. MB]